MTVAPTVNEPADLAIVRRFEAAGFRAWPAASVHYDGAWAIRLTPGHPAKRLNSINPLDPGDNGDVEARLSRAAARFEAIGRPMIARVTPLAGSGFAAALDRLGWRHFEESLVMRVDLGESLVQDAMDHIPLKDLPRFVTAALRTQGTDASIRSGLTDVIGSILAEAGLFALTSGHLPLATAICVHDGDLAGLFEVATAQAARRQGHARRLVLSALKWARLRGAHHAWLQVGVDNDAALGLYRSLGFSELYRYHYRRPS